MRILYKYVIVLILMCTMSLQGHSQSWTHVPVDPAEGDIDLLGSADVKGFLDEPTPIWAILAPYVTTAGRNDDCFSLRGLDDLKKPLRYIQDGVRDPGQLEFILDEVDGWLDKYSFDGLLSNQFSPQPVTVYAPEFSEIQPKSWVANKLVFCQMDYAARDTSPEIFQFVFGAWDAPDYSGWQTSEHLKVHPARWNDLQGDDFTRFFEAAFGLIRQGDHIMHGQFVSEAQRSRNDWAGAMGLLPAIALIETENAIGEARQGYSHPRERYKYMPMQLHKRFTAYRARNADNTDVDEDRFSSMAYWWFMLTHVLEDPSVRETYLEELMGQRYRTSLVNFKSFISRMIDTVQEERSDGIRFYNAQFAAAYANWPETRYDGDVSQDQWLDESFGGCERITLDEGTVFESRTLTLPLDTAQCVEVEARANRASYTGTVHIKMRGAPRAIRETTVAWSKTFKNQLCQDKDVHDSKCIVFSVPVRIESGDAERYLSDQELNVSIGQAFEARYIISRASDKSSGVSEFGIPEQDDLEITVTLEMGRVESPLKVADGWSTVFAGKQGEAPVGPFGDSESASPEDAIFNRGMGTSSAILSLAAEGGQIAIGLSNPAGDDLIFVPEDHTVLPSESTGTFLAQAGMTLAEGGIHTLQDPDKPSRLIISEHSDEALVFKGEANLCFMREEDEDARFKRMISEGMQAGMIDDLEERQRAFDKIEDDLDLDDACGGAFQRGTVLVEGSVPFPKTWTKDGRLTTWQTEEYLTLRDLQADRIRDALFGGGGNLASSPGNGPSSDGPRDSNGPISRPVASGPSQSGGGAGLSCSAPIYSESSGCSCTCEAKVCLDQKLQTDAASGTEKGCRLFCGATWASC